MQDDLPNPIIRGGGALLPGASVTRRDRQAAEAATQSDLSPVEFARTVADLDYLAPAARRLAANQGFEWDEQYRLPAPESEEGKALYEGIPEEFLDSFAHARNAEHAKHIRARLKREMELEAQLGGTGIPGVLGRVALNFVDPAVLGLSAATGGLGAGAAAAQKASRLRRILAGGTSAAASNAALEAALVASSETRDWTDVAFAGVLGFGLGGAVSAFGRSAPDLARTEDGTHAFLRGAEKEEARQFLRENGIDEADFAEQLRTSREARLKAARERQESIVEEAMGEAEAFEDARLRNAQAAAAPDVADALRRADDARAEGSAATNDQLRAAFAAGRPLRETMPGKALARLQEIEDELAGLRGDTAQGSVGSQFQAARVRALEDEMDKLQGEHIQRLQRLAQKADDRAAAAQRALDEAEGDTFEALLRPPRTAADDFEIERLEDAGARWMREQLNVASGERALRELPEAPPREAPAAADVVDDDVPFDPDSVGAARVAGAETDESLRTGTDALYMMDDDDVAGTARTRFMPRFDIANTFRSSKLPAVRLLGRLVGDPVGPGRSGAVREIGASEDARNLQDRLGATFYRAFAKKYGDWLGRNGHNRIGDVKARGPRKQFMSQVTAYVRGQTEDVDEVVATAGDAARSVFREMGELAQDAGVRGFEDFEVDEFYVPRFYRAENVEAAVEEFGQNQIENAIADAMLRRTPDFPADKAATIARGYLKSIRKLGMQIDSSAPAGVRLDDLEQVRGMLREAGSSDAEVEEVIEALDRVKRARGYQEGKTRHARRRLDLDEDASLQLRRTEDGEVREFRIDELFENDMEQLMSRYVRSMSGHISIARRAGFKSEADFSKYLADVTELMANTGVARNTRERIKKYAQAAYDHLVGRSLEADPGSDYAQALRAIREMQFSRVMNQVGFAQINDLGNLFARGYLGETLKHMPALRGMLRRAQNGDLEDELARELEEWVGFGTDFLNDRTFTAHDELGYGAGADGFFNYIGHKARVWSRATSTLSGMAPINNITQRMAMRVVTERLAKEGRKPGSMPDHRLADLGLTREMAERIGQQLEAHGSRTTALGGLTSRQKSTGLPAWDDLEARNAFLDAVNRDSRRIIQAPDFGATHPWMHTTEGKVMFQFRNFVVSSYTMQTLHGVAQRDSATATAFAASFALSALSYTVQQYLNTMGDPEARAERLTPENIALSAFQRSTYSSLIPAAIDTGVALSGADPLFAFGRSTGLPTDIVTGNPTFDYGRDLLRAQQGVARSAFHGDEFSDTDLRAVQSLLPFQNFLPVQIMFNEMRKALPEEN